MGSTAQDGYSYASGRNKQNFRERGVKPNAVPKATPTPPRHLTTAAIVTPITNTACSQTLRAR